MDKLLELDATHQRALLLSILNSISDGVIMAGCDGLLFMNPAAHRITGIPQTENGNLDLSVENWSQVFGCYSPSDENVLVPVEELPLVRATKGERILEQELLLKNKFLPHPVWISISGSPLIGLPGGVVIFKDITDRKRKEAEILRSHADLQQFAHIAAHDLQEPLRTVTGYLNLLSERYRGRMDEKADKYITNAVNGALRMQGLIGDLLAYSRVATKQQALRLVDSREILSGVIQDLEKSIVERGAVIECNALPRVFVDANQLSQVFQNLISNALKYCKEKPVIKITASRERLAWKFAIQDNGIGFEMKYAERIFLIFQRLHTRDEYQGTGVGLAICRRILERFGGKIWAESSIGSGTTFFFTIPVLEKEEEN